MNYNRSDTPVHDWFSLTRSAYLVIPRLALEAMSVEWQARLVALLNEAHEAGLETPEYGVFRKDRAGRFAGDPWSEYRHGRIEDVCPQFKRKP